MVRRAGRVHTVRAIVALLLLGLLLSGGWWTFGALEARARVDNLVTARMADVPDLVRQLQAYRRWADPLLRAKATQAELDEGKRLRVALALLPGDAGQADYLGDRLLQADEPEEVKAIRDLLHERALDSPDRFWPVLADEKEERPRRLRAACALALADEADPRWGQVADEMVRCLAGENVLLLRDWAELLSPVRGQLVPHVARRLAEADAGACTAFLALLRAYPEEAPAALHAILDRALPAAAKQEDREALARQQAQAAVALLHLGRPERVWPWFHQTEDPTRRTYLIHQCASLGLDPAFLADHLLRDGEQDASVRQGLLLALGEYSTDQRAEVLRGPLAGRVLQDYQGHPDPGVHAAAEWLLRQWQMADRLAQVDAVLRKAGPGLVPDKIDQPRWVVNGQGQTLVVIPAPGKFWVGSPRGEKGKLQGEDRREVRIDYAFAMATKLVRVAEFKKCWPEFKHPEQLSPGPDTPVNGVSWYDAARYCNWLSEQEGIPEDQWCYEKNAEGEYAEGMKVKPNYQRLKGYRLPREAEWEYACRTGTVTPWSCGSDEALLRHYAWYLLNSGTTMHPAGVLKPNGLGLFDMHGNAWQWCQEVWEQEGNKDIEDVNNNQSRVLRGGSFFHVASFVRSAFRNANAPAIRLNYFGFRPARTYH